MSTEDAKGTLKKILVNKELYGQTGIEAAYKRVLGELTINFSLLHFNLDLRLSHLAEKLIASVSFTVPEPYREKFKDLVAKTRKRQKSEWIHANHCSHPHCVCPAFTNYADISEHQSPILQENHAFTP